MSSEQSEASLHRLARTAAERWGLAEGELALIQHEDNAVFRPPSSFERPEWDFETLFGPGSVLRQPAALERIDVSSREVVSDAIETLRPILVRDQRAPNSWGLIHGDLHRDNMLVETTEVGFIDFDDCGYGSFWMDLAAGNE